jgi:hypothetical protein
MSVGQGFNTKAGIGKQAAWQTGIAVDEILTFTAEDVNKLFQRLENNYLDQTAGRRESQGDIAAVSGSISAQAIYDELDGATVKGIDSLIYLALGTATYNSGTNTANQFTPAYSIDIAYTFAFYKDVSVWEVQGGRINTLTIEGTIGEGVNLTADVVGRDLARTGDAGIINAAAAITGLSVSAIPVMLDLQHAVFRLGTHGDALAAADQQKISQFSLAINNNLAVDQYATPHGAATEHTDSSFILEPIRSGKREITFSVTFPRYETNNSFGWLNNDTPVQADLKFTDPSANAYEFNIYLPNMRVVTPAAPVPDASVFPLTIEFIALVNGSINDSMNFSDATAITDEIGIETTNGRTAIP